MHNSLRPSVLVTLCLVLVSIAIGTDRAQATEQDVLEKQEWENLDASVERALLWLSQNQQPNGSFPTLVQGQPGVTSLCVLSFAAHGHLPGEGPHGDQLTKAVDSIISCQKANGLIAMVAPRGEKIPRTVSHEIGSTTAYNHAIASLTLSELYGISGAAQANKLRPVIEQAIKATLQMQRWPAERDVDKGGWRYLHSFQGISADLSITGWQLMFLRSAKNAGFDIPNDSVDQAVRYVKRCFHPEYKTFVYKLNPGDTRSRAMAGAGVLALAHAGLHNTSEARLAADWILEHDFDRYNQRIVFSGKWHKDRYHYAAFNCTQAMYQIGGKHWKEFFPRIVKTLVENQGPNGAWQAEKHEHEFKFGQAYTTSLVVLTLGAPNQLLPIFQR